MSSSIAQEGSKKNDVDKIPDTDGSTDMDDTDDITDDNRRYQAPDADVIIISSDGYKFRVYSYVLMGAGNVFKDMMYGHSTPSSTEPKTIRLTEVTAEIARLLLDCWYGSWTCFIEGARDKMRELACLVSLLQKYDCPAVSSTVLRVVEGSFLVGDFDQYDAFAIAALLDNVPLAVTAIKNNGRPQTPWAASDTGIEKKDLGSSLSGRNVLDLRACPFDDYECLPPRYAHGLLRATYLAKPDGIPEDRDWDALGNHFKGLMEEQKEADEKKRKQRSPQSDEL